MAAPTIDASTVSTARGTSSSWNYDHTAGSDPGGVVVIWGCRDPNQDPAGDVTCTYGGTSMAEVGGQERFGVIGQVMFKLSGGSLNGTKSVAFTLGGGLTVVDQGAITITIDGCDETDLEDLDAASQGKNTTSSTNITTTADETLLIDGIVLANGNPANLVADAADQTEFGDLDLGNRSTAWSYKTGPATAGASHMNWDHTSQNDHFVHRIIAVKPAAGGPAALTISVSECIETLPQLS